MTTQSFYVSAPGQANATTRRAVLSLTEAPNWVPLPGLDERPAVVIVASSLGVTTYLSDANSALTASRITSDPVHNQDALDERVKAALATNATYLAIGSPSNAQNLAQIRALTRQMSALIRREMDDYLTVD